ncbi:hypothetical protein J6590_001337 [Homalodisca vitripennis]|nr:hypothetical protein J6590_001337 [Homalodisca vitripennis]
MVANNVISSTFDVGLPLPSSNIKRYSEHINKFVSSSPCLQGPAKAVSVVNKKLCPFESVGLPARFIGNL